MQIRNIFSIPLGITVNEQHKKIQKNLVKYCTKLKNKKKKLARKGKDIGEEYGLKMRVADKNNPIVVNFD